MGGEKEEAFVGFTLQVSETVEQMKARDRKVRRARAAVLFARALAPDLDLASRISSAVDLQDLMRFSECRRIIERAARGGRLHGGKAEAAPEVLESVTDDFLKVRLQIASALSGIAPVHPMNIRIPRRRPIDCVRRGGAFYRSP